MKKLLVLLALLTAACGPLTPRVTPSKPPVVVNTPAEPNKVGATIRDEEGNPLPDAIAVLHPDSGLEATCVNDGGRVTCETLAQDGAHLDVRLQGYVDVETPTFHIGEILAEIHLQHARVDLPRLGKRNDRYVGPVTGGYFTVAEASDFNLLAMLADDKVTQVEEVLKQREHPDPIHPEAPGFNVLRVFTAFSVCPDGNCPPRNQPIGRLVPREHPDLYTILIPRLADMASRHHEYLELVGFTGPYNGVLDGDVAKVQHWLNLCGAAQKRPNINLELINERSNDPNRDVPFDQLQDCPGVLTSHGSETEDGDPVQPPWGVMTYHPGGGLSGEWQRRGGHDAMDLSTKFHVPVIANEGPRFDDQVNDCNHARGAAQAFALLAAGGTYHSIAGKHSDLWSGKQLECAISWLQGVWSIPLDCQDAGGYNHRIDLEDPRNNPFHKPFLRVFQRGTTRMDCVAWVPPNE